MKKIFLTLSVFFISAACFSQNEVKTEQKTEPCTSVILKFKNFSFRNYQISVPNQMTISAARLGTTTFHVAPGQQMMFSMNGQDYTLVKAGTDTKTTEKYNLNRLVKKQKRKLGIR